MMETTDIIFYSKGIIETDKEKIKIVQAVNENFLMVVFFSGLYDYGKVLEAKRDSLSNMISKLQPYIYNQVNLFENPCVIRYANLNDIVLALRRHAVRFDDVCYRFKSWIDFSNRSESYIWQHNHRYRFRDVNEELVNNHLSAIKNFNSVLCDPNLCYCHQRFIELLRAK